VEVQPAAADSSAFSSARAACSSGLPGVAGLLPQRLGFRSGRVKSHAFQLNLYEFAVPQHLRPVIGFTLPLGVVSRQFFRCALVNHAPIV
jgi:hypothetical protein